MCHYSLTTIQPEGGEQEYIAAHLTNNFLPLPALALPTLPVSAWYNLYASRKWSGESGPVSPRRAWTVRAVKMRVERV